MIEKGALHGVRVIDISTVIAGPYAASYLADFGAEVIKVEMPVSGDAFREMGPFVNGKSIRWQCFGRNKKSVTLDLRQEEGKQLFLKLISKGDVVIENFRTGTLDKWGISVSEMRKVNPDIIVTHVTGYGQTGPNSHLAGFGTPCTAFSGVTYIMGYPDRPPVSPSFSLADYIAGLNAALGTMIALYNRDALGGKGQEIDVSLYESLFRMMDTIVAEYHTTGRVKERTPQMSGSASPSGTFLTKDDKWIVLVCSTDRTFEYLTRAMERDDLLKDYSSSKERLQSNAYIMDITSNWCRSLTWKELHEICEKVGVPVNLIYSIADIYEDPHYIARQNIIEMPDTTFGTIKMPNVTPILSETPGSVNWIGQKLGESNEEIFLGLLELDRSTYDDLIEKKIV